MTTTDPYPYLYKVTLRFGNQHYVYHDVRSDGPERREKLIDLVLGTMRKDIGNNATVEQVKP